MNIEDTATRKIPSPSWDSVRSIYKKLSDEFHVLTDSYKIELTPLTKSNLDHLIILIDDVDQCIDEIPDKSIRDSITESLIHFLQEKDEKHVHEEAHSFQDKLATIKQIVHQERIQPRFVGAVKNIFHFTELKRHTESIEKIIQLVQAEGEATAELPLSILKIDKEEAFGLFFTRLCRIMGVADLFMDARSDYKNGYTVIKPSLKLYFRLLRIIIKDGIKILFSFPRKMNFIAYCFKFSVALIRE